jgi:hypothetical protein
MRHRPSRPAAEVNVMHIEPGVLVAPKVLSAAAVAHWRDRPLVRPRFDARWLAPH